VLERELISRLCDALRAATMRGKDVVIAHLTRASGEVATAQEQTERGVPPQQQAWRHAISEVRCAMERMFECIVQEASTARGEPLTANQPAQFRERLLALGILTSTEERELASKAYGLGSKQSAHPGFPAPAEAELRIGLMLPVMWHVLQVYDEAMRRGFSLPPEEPVPDMDVGRLAKVLKSHIVPDQSLDATISVDASGIRRVQVQPKPGAPPLELKFQILAPEALEKLRQALEEGQDVTFEMRAAKREIHVEFDPRVAHLATPFNHIEGAFQIQVPAERRHAVRIQVGGGSVADVPFAELVVVGLIRTGVARVAIRSKHLAHEFLIDIEPDTRRANFTVRPCSQATAAQNLHSLRLLVAGSRGESGAVRRLSDDRVLIPLPLAGLVRLAPPEYLTDQNVRFHERLAELEEAAGVPMVFAQELDAEDVFWLERAHELYTVGRTRIPGSVTLKMDAEGSRMLGREMLKGGGPTFYADLKDEVFEAGGLRIPVGPVRATLCNPITEPEAAILASVTDDAESVLVRVSSPPPGFMLERLAA